MATPVVSAAGSHTLQCSPALTPHQVKARLMKIAYKSFPLSSISYTSHYDQFTIGAGCC